MGVIISIFKSIFNALTKLFLQPIFLVLMLIVVTSSSIMLFTKNRTISGELSEFRDDPNAYARKELEDLVQKVGVLVQLPEGEYPTAATVMNKDAVSNQVFFKNAENGDRVLIYTEARKAILYRPSTNRVIEIASINIGENQAGISPVVEGGTTKEEEEETVEPIRVAIYNGTENNGLVESASNKIASDLPDLDTNVVTREETGWDYNNTVVVILNDAFTDAAGQIAGILGASIGDLPDGEVSPDADVLVILGSDYSLK